MQFDPLNDRVAIRRLDPAAKTKGGVLLPDNAQDVPVEGEVLTVGPGRRDDAGRLVPMTVKPGDRVLFGKWSGAEVKLGGQDLLVMPESDILGICRK